MNKIVIFISFLASLNAYFSQTPSENCIDMNPICTGYTFIANAGESDAINTEPGNNYDCLMSAPNPTWFYFDIATSGSIDIALTAVSDIDFIVWGPFSSLSAAQTACGSLGTIPATPNNGSVVDCSFSTAAVEDPSIPNAISGEVYVMLVTNYANVVQNIVVEQVGGTGSLQCPNGISAITDISVNTTECYDNGDFEFYNIYGNIAYTNPPNSGNLVVEDCNGNLSIVDSYPFAQSPISYYLGGLPANGNNCNVTSYFTSDITSSSTESFTAPFCGESCPSYNIDVSSLPQACGNQLYTMEVANTGCNGYITFNVVGNYGSWGNEISWYVSSVLTGNIIASGGPGLDMQDINVNVGQIDNNVEGNIFTLVVNDVFGDGFSDGGYITIQQAGLIDPALINGNFGSTVSANYNPNTTISSSTLIVQTPSGDITNIATNCLNHSVQFMLSNPNFCTPLNVDLPWSITCDNTGELLSNGVHSVSVFPQVPSTSEDIVSINWNQNSCEWDVSPNNDCDELDIGNLFTISPNPNELGEYANDGTEDFTTTYNGFVALDCCSTGGGLTPITYNVNKTSEDAILVNGPFGGVNNAALIEIAGNGSGGNATSLDLDVDLTGVCVYASSDQNWWVTIYVDDVVVFDEMVDSSIQNYSVSIDLSSMPNGYNANSMIEVYVYPNNFSDFNIGYNMTWDENDPCPVDLGEWNFSTFDVALAAIYEQTLNDSISCTYSTTEAYTACVNCNVYDTISYEGCIGDDYSIVFNGVTYNESNPFGVDTLNVIDGCDSVITIDMFFETCIPIQPITPHMEAYVNGSTINALNPLDTGFVDICLGDTIMFVATPEFLSSLENTGTGYSQDVNSNIDFAWNIDGVTFSNNDTIWYVPTVANGYLVNLIITDQYDQSAEITSKIRISMPPDFSGVYAAQDAVCAGGTTEIYGGSNGEGSSFTIPGGSFGFSDDYEGLTYLPDSSGAQYAVPITVDGFPQNATIENEGDMSQVCITLEHSYAGDLEIWLQCPNGSVVPLVDAFNPGFFLGGISGFGTFMGDPIDDVAGSGPGEGWEYCFSSVLNDIGPMSQNWGNTIPAPNFGNNGPSVNPENIYAPESSFAMLSGCPINGEWTLFVQDNLLIDDGFIFGWGIDFNTSSSGISGYQNYVDSAWWSPNPTIIENIGDSSILVAPEGEGDSYTFNITDDFGCSYDTTVFVGVIDVAAAITAEPTEGCAPLFVSYDYTNSVGDSFYLDFGDGATHFDSVPGATSYLFMSNGSLVSTLYVNNQGCSDTAYVNINVGETTNYVTDSAYCAEVYNWNGFLIYDSGTYTQEFQTANGCDSTVVLDITFVEIDFALDFSADQQSFTEPPFVVQFTNETPDIDDYIFSWDFGDGTTLQSNDINVFHEYTSNGTFSVTLYADDIDVDCSDTLLQADYIFTTGQSSIYENEMVTYQIHPNPTSNLIYIKSEVPLNNTFSIFDQQGRLIRKGILEGKDTQVSLEDLSRGAYTIQVAGGFKPTVIIKN